MKTKQKFHFFRVMLGPSIKSRGADFITVETYVGGPINDQIWPTVQITFIFIDFRVCDFAFAFKTQNAPCVSRFKRVLFSDRFQFAF